MVKFFVFGRKERKKKKRRKRNLLNKPFSLSVRLQNSLQRGPVITSNFLFDMQNGNIFGDMLEGLFTLGQSRKRKRKRKRERGKEGKRERGKEGERKRGKEGKREKKVRKFVFFVFTENNKIPGHQNRLSKTITTNNTIFVATNNLKLGFGLQQNLSRDGQVHMVDMDISLFVLEKGKKEERIGISEEKKTAKKKKKKKRRKK